MNIEFTKYQGAGNDFVVIDDRNKSFITNNNQLIKNICDRKYGIGSDGLILLRNHSQYDFEMIYFNADGFLGSMCGNGGRCIVDFAKSLSLFDKECTFLAADGLHFASWEKDNISLKMSDVIDIESNNNFSFLNTGSPHYIKRVKNLDTFDVYNHGKEIRYNKRFEKEGTNVNFIDFKDGILNIRTYERGVEDETLACGTGTVASVIALHNWGVKFIKPLTVNAKGGSLKVDFEFNNGIYSKVFLIGPAELVFKGSIKC
jgi:diaminopimelate epimerase